MIVQNKEYVRYTAFFKPEERETADVKAIIDLIGVQIKTYKIEQDENFFIAEVVAIYAWKILILDRLFSEGAEKITIERL